MQQFRRITSLQEDMAALGLAQSAPKRDMSFPSEKPSRRDERRLSEDKKRVVEYEDFDLDQARAEAKKAKKKKHKKMESRRLQSRKQRSESRLRTQTESRRQILKRTMGKSMGMLESLKELNLEVSGNVYETLRRGFGNVDLLARTLGRKFAVIEDKMAMKDEEEGDDAGSGLPVENPNHPPYGYVDPMTYAKQGGKEGDATDYAKDAPKGNLEDEDDEHMEKEPELTDKPEFEDDDDEDGSAYGSKKYGSDYDDSVYGSDYEDEDDEEGMPAKKVAEGKKAKKKKYRKEDDEEDEKEKDKEKEEEDDEAPMPPKMGSKYKDEDEDEDEKEKEKEKDKGSVVMSDEMFNFRLEAQDAMDQLKQHVISPEEAGNILRDMVQYLGGAMKMYMDLAQNIGKYAYAGIGAPQPDPDMVEKPQGDRKYIGKDQPDSAPGKPEVYTQRT